MKRIYATLAVLSFGLSLLAGISVPQEPTTLPTFDKGEAYAKPADILYGGGLVYDLFYKVELSPAIKSNRLLVITEPTWCPPCRDLDPVLEKLQKQGYEIYKYTQSDWFKAKGKPDGIPKALVKEGRRPLVPTLLFVKADTKVNKVQHWARGWNRNERDDDYIKRYLSASKEK